MRKKRVEAACYDRATWPSIDSSTVLLKLLHTASYCHRYREMRLYYSLLSGDMFTWWKARQPLNIVVDEHRLPENLSFTAIYDVIVGYVQKCQATGLPGQVRLCHELNCSCFVPLSINRLIGTKQREIDVLRKPFTLSLGAWITVRPMSWRINYIGNVVEVKLLFAGSHSTNQKSPPPLRSYMYMYRVGTFTGAFGQHSPDCTYC